MKTINTKSVITPFNNYYLTICYKKMTSITKKIPRTFLNQEKLHPQLFCPICHKVFDGPVIISCGHSFCYICILIWMRRQSECPVCKKEQKRFQTWVNLAINEIIADLKTKCSYSKCQWIGNYRQLKRHQRKCPFGPKKESFQIPASLFVDQVVNGPLQTLDQKKWHLNQDLNPKKQNFNSKFADMPKTHFSRTENFQTFPVGSKDMIQAEDYDFEYLHQDQQESDSDESRGVILDEEQYEKAHFGQSNQISLERRTTMTASSYFSKRNNPKEVSVDQLDDKKYKRIIINSQNKDQQNQNQVLKSKYKRIKNIQYLQNLQNSQNQIAQISLTKNKPRTYLQPHLSSYHAYYAFGLTNKLKNELSKSFDGSKA